MTPDLDQLVSTFVQARDRADGFNSSTHAGVAAVAVAVSNHLLERLRTANPEAFRERAIESLIQLGAIGQRSGGAR